jgi:membrane protein
VARLRWLAALTSLGIAAGYGLQKSSVLSKRKQDKILRGRTALRPWQIPWLGWKDVLARTWNGIFDSHLLSSGAAVAFFALLAVIPGLAVLISFYGLFADPGLVSRQLATLALLLPDAVQTLLQEHAQRIATQSSGKVSFNIIVSLMVAVWGANAAVKGLFEGLNVIYGEKEKRSFLTYNSVTMLTTLAGVIVVAAFLAAMVLVPKLLDFVALGPGISIALRVLLWPVLFALGGIGIATLYWVGPSRERPRVQWVLPGAIAAAFVWAVSSSAFSWYVATLSNYNAMYGSLAAVVVFMTWLWMSAVIVLLGAELNSELEHQTAEDTTYGEPMPLGSRGAVVADRIGPALSKK